MYPLGNNANGVHGQRQAGNVSCQQKQPQRALPQSLLHQQPDDQHSRQRRAEQKQRVHDPLAMEIGVVGAGQKEGEHLLQRGDDVAHIISRSLGLGILHAARRVVGGDQIADQRRADHRAAEQKQHAEMAR